MQIYFGYNLRFNLNLVMNLSFTLTSLSWFPCTSEVVLVRSTIYLKDFFLIYLDVGPVTSEITLSPSSSSSSLCGSSAGRCCHSCKNAPCTSVLCLMIAGCQANVKWYKVGFDHPIWRGRPYWLNYTLNLFQSALEGLIQDMCRSSAVLSS